MQKEDENNDIPSSDSFYRKLGFKVIDIEYQMRERLTVDIFACDMDSLKNILQEKLSKYTAR